MRPENLSRSQPQFRLHVRFIRPDQRRPGTRPGLQTDAPSSVTCVETLFEVICDDQELLLDQVEDGGGDEAAGVVGGGLSVRLGFELGLAFGGLHGVADEGGCLVGADLGRARSSPSPHRATSCHCGPARTDCCRSAVSLQVCEGVAALAPTSAGLPANSWVVAEQFT